MKHLMLLITFVLSIVIFLSVHAAPKLGDDKYRMSIDEQYRAVEYLFPGSKMIAGSLETATSMGMFVIIHNDKIIYFDMNINNGTIDKIISETPMESCEKEKPIIETDMSSIVDDVKTTSKADWMLKCLQSRIDPILCKITATDLYQF